MNDFDAGTPAAKAAPKRRRGGKHRNKGLLASEAAVEAAADDSGEVEAVVQSSSDGPAEGDAPQSLLPLQLERLASNGAAGDLFSLGCNTLVLLRSSAEKVCNRLPFQLLHCQHVQECIASVSPVLRT